MPSKMAIFFTAINSLHLMPIIRQSQMSFGTLSWEQILVWVKHLRRNVRSLIVVVINSLYLPVFSN